MGRGNDFRIAFVHNTVRRFCDCPTPPTSVGFMARAALTLGMPRSPKTSLIAHAKTGSPTDGLEIFCENKFYPAVKREEISFKSFYVQDEIVFSKVGMPALGFRSENHFRLKVVRPVFARPSRPPDLAFGHDGNRAFGRNISD